MERACLLLFVDGDVQGRCCRDGQGRRCGFLVVCGDEFIFVVFYGGVQGAETFQDVQGRSVVIVSVSGENCDIFLPETL